MRPSKLAGKTSPLQSDLTRLLQSNLTRPQGNFNSSQATGKTPRRTCYNKLPGLRLNVNPMASLTTVIGSSRTR